MPRTRDLPSLSELTAALGPSSDDSHSIGELPSRPPRLPAQVRVPPPRPVDWSKWTGQLWWRASRHAGTDGITRGIETLPGDLADRLRSRAELGDTVRLVVVQDMDGRDPHGARGFYLGPEAMAWLGRAGAALDIDQYADLVSESDEVEVGYRPPLDFESWRDSLAASLRYLEALRNERETGATCTSFVAAASTRHPAKFPAATPEQLMMLYGVIDQASLLTVDDGCLIHPAAWLDEADERGHPRQVDLDGTLAEVVTFGSDSVGGYFALAAESGQVLYISPAGSRGAGGTSAVLGAHEVATDLDAFLRQLLDIVDGHVEKLVR